MSKEKQNSNDLGAVSGSPSFEDWLNKYFETPKMNMKAILDAQKYQQDNE